MRVQLGLPIFGLGSLPSSHLFELHPTHTGVLDPVNHPSAEATAGRGMPADAALRYARLGHVLSF